MPDIIWTVDSFYGQTRKFTPVGGSRYLRNSRMLEVVWHTREIEFPFQCLISKDANFAFAFDKSLQN